MTASLAQLLLPIAAAPIGIETDDIGGGWIMPPDASTFASSIDGIFMFIFWLSVFFFVLIVGLMTLFAVKYRRKSPDQKAESQLTHHTPLELTWTIIPLILSVGIFWVGLEGYVEMREPPANSYEVNVTGQKWNWTFEHRNGATSTKVLRVPAGQPVKLIMTSTDVLHSFFIPSFRVKQDVVPGRYSHLWFEAPEPGVYQIFCTEYCGTKHSQMVASVEVMEPEAFAIQIEKDANRFDGLAENKYEAAALTWIYPRCSSCHSLEQGVRMTGPSFWEVHEAWGTTDGGRPIVDENYIRTSILVPNDHVLESYVAGQMPSFQGQLKETELAAMIRFLKNLDEVISTDGKPTIDLSILDQEDEPAEDEPAEG